ncbi:hypothetical protein LCGC14_2430140, partial [marine sediment metagenome]
MMKAADVEHETPPKAHKETGATEKKDYADPSRYKYPVHTEKNTRAALAYFSQPKNRSGYSSEEVKKVARKIITAAKKFGIDVDENTYKIFGLRKGIEEIGERLAKAGKIDLKKCLELRKGR